MKTEFYVKRFLPKNSNFVPTKDEGPFADETSAIAWAGVNCRGFETTLVVGYKEGKPFVSRVIK